MERDRFDLDAYLDRVGLEAAGPPTLATLRRLHEAHACAVPFEHLDVLAGGGVSLRPADVEAKLVGRRRGGYCFEQNALLGGVLERLGFRVRYLAARVLLNAAAGVRPPRTHLFLAVGADGREWVADVGIGGLTPIRPFPLEVGGPYENGLEPRRIVMREGPLPTFVRQAKLGDGWADVCEFSGEAIPPPDREVANWFTSTHPDSKFRRTLRVALVHADGSRSYLNGREFTRRAGAKVSERVEVRDRRELSALLDERFALPLPAGADVGFLWSNGLS